MQISDKAQHIPQALSVYVNQLVYELKQRKRDIITLSLGESHFETPYTGIDKLDVNQGLHYCDSQGLPLLRTKIAQYYQTLHAASFQPDKVLISAGSKIILFMCMQALLNPGDEVILHEPAWLSYQEQARLVGATVNFVPYHASLATFSDYFSESTRMVILNNPNNPSGYTYTKDFLLELHRICQERNIWLVVDEAYSDFVVDDSFYSMAALAPSLENLVVVNSLSKNMGVSGWRVGYAIANNDVVGALIKLNQHLVTCAPTILQQFLAEHFDELLTQSLPQVQKVVLKRRQILNMLDNIGLKYLPGNATFYFFIAADQYDGDMQALLLYLLLEKNIAVVPGSAYGQETNKFLRISIGTESEERIEHALRTIKQVLSGPPIDSADVHGLLAELRLPSVIHG